MNDQHGMPHNPEAAECAARPTLAIPTAVILMLTVAGISGMFCLTPTFLIASMLSASLFAVLLLLAKWPLALLAVPLSYLAALLFSASPAGALAALGYVPAGIALAVCIAKRKKCAPTVFWMTLLSLITVIGACGVCLFLAFGSLTGGFMTVYNLVLENTRNSILLLIENASINASLQSVYQEYLLTLDESFKITLYLLPGLLVATFFFLSWLTAKLTKRFLGTFRAEKYFFRKYWRVYVSAWWAKLFIGLTLLSVVISFFEGKIPDVLYYTAANLLLVFEPPILMVGIRRILTLLKKLRQSGAFPVYFAACTIFVLCLCCSLQFLVIGLTYVGAFHAISKDKRKKAAAAFAAAIGSISVQPDEDAVEETPAEQNESAPGESTASHESASHESADPTPADTDTDDNSKN